VQPLQDNLEGKCGAYDGGCESMAALAAFERGLRRQGVAHGVVHRGLPRRRLQSTTPARPIGGQRRPGARAWRWPSWSLHLPAWLLVWVPVLARFAGLSSTRWFSGEVRDCEGDAATSRQLPGNSYIGYDRLGRNVWCCARTATRPAGCCGPKT
jgi:hypothetical protein